MNLEKLNKGGKIYFLLTLYDNRNAFTSFMEMVKPYLKFATTVDFGKATFKNEFHEYLNQYKLKISHSERLSLIHI